jgi:hypothetical protein
MEIERRKEEGECRCCAGPPDLIGHHTVNECERQIKIDPCTAINLKVLQIESISQQSFDNSSHTQEEYDPWL